MQVHQAWLAAAAANAGGGDEAGGGAATAAEQLAQCFEHDGGHFLPATKQVVAAACWLYLVSDMLQAMRGQLTSWQVRDALAAFVAKFR